MLPLYDGRIQTSVLISTFSFWKGAFLFYTMDCEIHLLGY